MDKVQVKIWDINDFRIGSQVIHPSEMDTCKVVGLAKGEVKLQCSDGSFRNTSTRHLTPVLRDITDFLDSLLIGDVPNDIIWEEDRKRIANESYSWEDVFSILWESYSLGNIQNFWAWLVENNYCTPTLKFIG